MGYPSMAQDIMKGRRTEIDYLNGYIERKGKELRIPTPFNSAMSHLIQQVERGHLQPHPDNLKLITIPT